VFVVAVAVAVIAAVVASLSLKAPPLSRRLGESALALAPLLWVALSWEQMASLSSVVGRPHRGRQPLGLAAEPLLRSGDVASSCWQARPLATWPWCREGAGADRESGQGIEYYPVDAGAG